MASRSKAKGYRGEVEFAALIEGKRVLLSGAAPGFPGDVVDEGAVLQPGALWSVKRCRDRQTKTGRSPVERVLAGLEDLLKGFDAVAIRKDHGEWVVAMRLSTLLDATLNKSVYDDSTI